MEASTKQPAMTPNAWLKKELESRQQKNANFSARAFARQLEISPGRVSEYLSGKRTISKKMAAKIADKIGFDADKKSRFLSLAEAAEPDFNDKFQELNDEALFIVQNWYHFAILNLVKTKGFKNSNTEIARRLNISEQTASTAVARLIRCGLLERRDKQLIRTKASLTTTRDISSNCIRESHRDRLVVATKKLAETNVNMRDYSSIVFNLDPKDLDKFKDAIEKFRRKMAKNSKKTAAKEVYNLSIQLFPLSIFGEDVDEI